MLSIAINLETGLAKPAQTAAIKAGGSVPVMITFSANPGTTPAIELALSPQSSTPTVLAYLNTFAAQSQTVYTGFLDANDTRLIAHLVGKSTATLDCEVVFTPSGGVRRPFPNFPITTQPPIITGPATSQGGPIYLPIGSASGAVRITGAGLEIRDTSTNAWRRLTFVDGELVFTQL